MFAMSIVLFNYWSKWNLHYLNNIHFSFLPRKSSITKKISRCKSWLNFSLNNILSSLIDISMISPNLVCPVQIRNIHSTMNFWYKMSVYSQESLIYSWYHWTFTSLNDITLTSWWHRLDVLGWLDGCFGPGTSVI